MSTSSARITTPTEAAIHAWRDRTPADQAYTLQMFANEYADLRANARPHVPEPHRSYLGGRTDAMWAAIKLLEHIARSGTASDIITRLDTLEATERGGK